MRRPGGSAWSRTAPRGAALLASARRSARTSARCRRHRVRAAMPDDPPGRLVPATRRAARRAPGMTVSLADGLGADSTSSNFWPPRSPTTTTWRSLRIPHHQAGDAGVAAEQGVAAPDRSGEHFRQFPLTMPPASQLSLVAVLERHRGDAARPAAATREANQSHRRAPALELLPHVLVGEQLATPVAQPHGVRPAGLPAGRRPAQLVGLRLAGRARAMAPPACAVQHPRRLAAVTAGLAAQSGPHVT